MDELVKLRAWWAHRQGLDGWLHGAAPDDVLRRTGWARSIGGANPYLQLFSRADTTREEADRAVADLAIHELPSVRGCTYVLPAADFALGLQLGAAAARTELAVCARLGVPGSEIDGVGAAVLTALEDAGRPMDPRELKTALGDVVRSLGAEGRKRGVSTTLPVALGLLQSTGEIRRVPVTGRLDRQRYAYARWCPSPVASSRLSSEEAGTELAHRYWAWTGGASPTQFRWFSALTARAATAAVTPLGLVPLTGDLLAPPEDAGAFADFRPPEDPDYALVSWIDGITLLRRDLPSVLDPADRERRLPAALATTQLGGLGDLPAQGIVDRGRVVGLWEYDPERAEIAWAPFGEPDDGLRAAVTRTEAYVRDQLGDARGSSLDNPAKRRERLDAIRTLAGEHGAGPRVR